jgi:1-acyl-sn-glycerol-3-phosphate acyltransferase
MYLSTLKRNWFVFTFAFNILVLWLILKVINNLPNSIINSTRKKEISSYLSCLIARIIFYLNPHVQVKDSSNWDLVQNNGSNIFLINHTSPIDAFLFAATVPLKYAAKIRTLFKAELFDVPFLGDITRYCGHFPVYFTNASLNNFSIDKQKQHEVTKNIKSHLNNGGHLAFFPEGQLNRADTKQLQPFRHGSFQIFAEHFATTETKGSRNLSLYCFLHKGLEKTWHPTAKLGGNPSQVNCQVFPLLSFRQFQAHEIQNSVQKNLDRLYLSKRMVAKL